MVDAGGTGSDVYKVFESSNDAIWSIISKEKMVLNLATLM